MASKACSECGEMMRWAMGQDKWICPVCGHEERDSANSRACNSSNPVVRKAMNAVVSNVSAERIKDEVLTTLTVADTDIDDGDISEAKQVLRSVRQQAFYYGLEKEWREVASRVGMNACAMNADEGGKCRVSLKIPFALKEKTQSDTMNYQQFIKWATENGVSKDTAASMWDKANKGGGVVSGYVTASCSFSLVEV